MRRALAGGVALALATFGGGGAWAQSGTADGPRIRALLVGAANYPASYREMRLGDLPGAENDAWLMAETLRARGAQATDIVVLASGAARMGLRAQGRPELAVIREALADLARRAKAGDQVVVLFSGHGLQQPEAVAGNEPDGLDEVFLPQDAVFLSGPGSVVRGLPIVRGALTDDEIGRALSAIRAKGADVLFIADFCHSGDSARGARGGGRQGDAKLGLDGIETPNDPAAQRKGGYVGFFASPAPLTASQNVAPFWLGPEAQPQGVLTGYTAVAMRDTSLRTWMDVARRVESYVVQHNGDKTDAERAPPPQFEGDLDSPVFAASAAEAKTRSWSIDKPPVLSDPPPPIERLSLDAGGLDGIRPGALLSLSLTDAKGSEKVVLYAKASEVGARATLLAPASGPRIGAQAWRSPRDADGQPLTGEARFIVRMVRNGLDPDITVALTGSSAKDEAGMSRVLAGLDLAGIGVSRAANPAVADLHVRIAGGQVHFDAAGAPDGKGYGAVAVSALPVQRAALQTRLRAIIEAAARQQRLRALLTDLSGEGGLVSGSEGAPVRLKVETFIWRSPAPASETAECPMGPDFASGEAIPEGAAPAASLGASGADTLRLRRCDAVFVRITNTETDAVDLTALLFRTDGAIEAIEFQDAGRSRLEPGRVGSLGYRLTGSLSRSRDDLILVGVRVPGGAAATQGLASNFAFLCQAPPILAGSAAGIAAAREIGCDARGRRRNPAAQAAAEVALGDLFEAAGRGDSRSADQVQSPGATGVQRISWTQESHTP